MNDHQKKIEIVNEKTPVSIILVTYHSEKTIIPCLLSIEKHLRADDEVIIVDNGSMDSTHSLIEPLIARLPQFNLHKNNQNLGYSRAVNIGVLKTTKPILVFLNPDTVVTQGWIKRLLRPFKDEGIGAVGPLSNFVAGEQNIAFHLKEDLSHLKGLDALSGILADRFNRETIRTKLLVGFCMAIRKEALYDIGLLDETLFLGNDDLDLSLRLRRKGYGLLIAKDSFIYHKGQQSFKSQEKSLTDNWVAESTDRLYYKLMRYHGPLHIPSSKSLWGMDWFQPTCTFLVNQPLTSIIILTYNQLEMTRKCVESIFRFTKSPFELIFVDNGSTDETCAFLKSIRRFKTPCSRIRVIENNKNLGFSKGNNQGLSIAYGEFLALLNNDTVVTENWLNDMINHSKDKGEIGLVGPVSNCVSGPQKIDGIEYNQETTEGLSAFSEKLKKMSQGRSDPSWRLVGFCLLIKRAVIEKIGGFDTTFMSGNFEDDDLCARANLAGFKAVIARDVYIHHFGSQTFLGNQIDYTHAMNVNWKLFRKKWHIESEDLSSDGYVIPPQKGGFDRAIHFSKLG